MGRSIGAKQKVRKRMGRPRTGKTPMIGLRLAPDVRRAVETWARKQEDRPNFSDAVRRLIERGLAT